MAVFSCIFLFFRKKRETRRARPHARSRNEKPGAARRPGLWRSFGEYIFLEDSRYTSQAKNGAAIKSLECRRFPDRRQKRRPSRTSAMCQTRTQCRRCPVHFCPVCLSFGSMAGPSLASKEDRRWSASSSLAADDRR